MAPGRSLGWDEIRREFDTVVNMTPAELAKWLDTEESRSVGWTRKGEQESVGHQSGRRIVEIQRKKTAELTDEDYAHMRKVSAMFIATRRRAVRRATSGIPDGAIR